MPAICGHILGADAVHKLLFRAQRDPESLTPDEVSVVREYDKGFDVDAEIRLKRERAAAEAAKATKAAPAQRAHLTGRHVLTEMQTLLVDQDRGLSESLSKVAEKWPDAPLPMVIFSGILEAMLDSHKQLKKWSDETTEKNVERNSRLDAIEAKLGSEPVAVPAAGGRLTGIETRLSAIEARLEGFEKRGPSMNYRGTFDEGTAYTKGDVISWGGSMWYCQKSTYAKPGLPDADSRAWVLCVKKGAEGRPGRDGSAHAKATV